MELKELKHDFINNSLRIEILCKLIIESLRQDKELENEYIDDLENFLNNHISLLKHLKRL
ncbi:MAG: hypothetical protein N4A33_03725 [Bacteriovoracaceae bacterium]|jgi:RNase P subunit RPR2|nr:hypothetical protein [Bacteriovoracaceae bacterium]